MKTAALLLLSLLPARVSGDTPAVRAVPIVPLVRPAPAVPVMERIPRCYVVYGYGTDRQGKGSFLDYNGNALPIGKTPQAIDVHGLKGSALAGLTWKPLVPSAQRAAK